MTTTKFLFTVALCFQFSVSHCTLNLPNQIKVGLIGNSFNTKVYKLTASIAVSDLYGDGVLPLNVTFEFQAITGCDDNSSLSAAIQLWDVDSVSAIIGPECDQGMKIVALMASIINKPLFGYFSMSDELANKEKYKTLSSVSYTMSYMAQAIRALLMFYNWNKISIIRTHPNCTILLSGIPNAFRPYNISIINDVPVDMSNDGSISNALNYVKFTTRIVLMCTPTSPRDALQVLQMASKLSMLNEEYVYIVPYFIRKSESNWKPWLDPNITSSTANAYSDLYKNVIVIATAGEDSADFIDLDQRLRAKTKSDPKSVDNFVLSPDDVYVLAPFYDAIYLYGLALNYSTKVNSSMTNGTGIVAATAVQDFIGSTGRVTFDTKAERIANYMVSKLDENKTLTRFLELGSDIENFDSTEIQVIKLSKFPFWGTINNEPPKVMPLCGFQGELCATAASQSVLSTTVVWIVCVIAILVVVFGIIAGVYFFIRKQRFERELLQSAWKIDLKKLQYISRSKVASGSVNSVETNKEYGSIGAELEDGKVQTFGIYEDNVVAVKRWQKLGHVTLKTELMFKLKTMKEMNHENVNRFFGLSLEQESTILCLWSYCAKRSLTDFIFNNEIHLDLPFQVSILRDIISGLEYIHASQVMYHGRLFMTNCLVDGRWIVKLSGFGLDDILTELRNHKIIQLAPDDPLDKLLCTAPELLRNRTVHHMRAVDIYGLGMIFYQVLFRKEPFFDFQLQAEEILKLILEGGNAAPRPILKSLKAYDHRLLALVGKCWQENPLNRPTASELKKEIFSSTKLFGKNLMDHVMSMLEKYASNLEKIVEERTAQLSEERRRADLLLYQMLPKTVAESLKNGQAVPPESFDCATVYFSDVVGFTKICSRSTPMEVVAMLNSLYSEFDEIIMTHDAYKVETIGDAYLVVSGLPVRNGMKHVTAMSDLSLDILKVLSKYKIPHLPDHILQVRIGLHSGPVAGGVVGLTMPRYCLFGDTVNYASRMESTGEAGKIHITQDTKQLLERHPEYIVCERGTVELKGKGARRTFWLLDKVDNDSNAMFNMYRRQN